MKPEDLLCIMHTAVRLKDTTRHCYTAGGRHESVAEHSWMLTLMAFLLKDEFPDTDMDKVIQMCIIHDLGECFTGDIPAFEKSGADEQTEKDLLYAWVDTLPSPTAGELRALFAEMERRETQEARIYKALDSLEAVIQHNQSPLETWSANEYALNLVYGDDKVAFSGYLTRLRQAVREETERKLAAIDLES